jgi:hypothetical protein
MKADLSHRTGSISPWGYSCLKFGVTVATDEMLHVWRDPVLLTVKNLYPERSEVMSQMIERRKLSFGLDES